MNDFDKAIQDYCKAIELDDGCKEAFINRSLTYKKQMFNEDNQEKKEELYDLMIADLQRALELDPDDKKTKSFLINNIKSNFNAKEQIAMIDEKIGDLELEDKKVIPALKQYIESCAYYLWNVSQGNKNYLADVERLISKIFSIDIKEKVLDLSKLSDKLSFFCQSLRSVSVDFYKNGNKEIAEKSFQILAKYDSDGKNCLLNLAFMKRRGETKYTHSTVSELLEKCSNLDNAIWCTNKALCYVKCSDNHEISWEKAVEIMNKPTENLNEALAWWNNISIVGTAENNMAMIFFAISERFQIADNIPTSKRIQTAINDGYRITQDIE